MTHTHDFSEVLSSDNGLTRRRQCGARLWEPETVALRFAGGNVVKRDGKLVFVKHAQTASESGTK